MLSSFFGKILERVAPTLTPTERLLSHLEGGKEDLALELFADPAVAPELNLAARNGGGNTAAHLAAAHGHCRVLKLVLGKRPACLNERSGSQDSTPLHLAASRGRGQAVALLLQAGGRKELEDALGRTASQVAKGGAVDAFLAGEKEATSSAPREALYTHGDGTTERVTVVKEHSETEGGGFTILVPSLGRERQTVSERLNTDPQALADAPGEPSPGVGPAVGEGARPRTQPVEADQATQAAQAAQAEAVASPSEATALPGALAAVSKEATPPHPPPPQAVAGSGVGELAGGDQGETGKEADLT